MNSEGEADGTQAAPADAVEVPESITCVDCGGRCGLLSRPDTDHDGRPIPYAAGDIVSYRCAECLDRWDMVLE